MQQWLEALVSVSDAHTKPELTALKQTVLPILQVLKDNSHHLLALQFALHMTFTAMETIVPMTNDQVC